MKLGEIMIERWGVEGVFCWKAAVVVVIVAIVLATDGSFVETKLLLQLSDWPR